MPTKCKDGKKRIEWEKFVIMPSDSEDRRASLMRDATLGIRNNKNIAILCARFMKIGLGKETVDYVVFLHRAGGDKRISHSSGPGSHASFRPWSHIREEGESTWKLFVETSGIPRM